MLVFWDQRLVLLSVPKTGSTALEGALAPDAAIVLRNPPALKHAPVYRYRRFFQPMLIQGAGSSGLETLAVVREPIDWLSSWYRYRHRDELSGHENSTRGINFDEFVLEYMKDDPAPLAAVGSQAKFLQDENGSLGVNHLFRYEAQPALLAFLEARLGRTITLNRRNVSPKLPVTLTTAVETRLRETRAPEFAVWRAGQT